LFLGNIPALPITNIVGKVWGHEYWVLNTDKYCMKILHLEPKFQCSLHYHNVKDETFIVLSGVVRLEYYDKYKNPTPDLMPHTQVIILPSGTSFHVEPGVAHRFSTANDEPANILEVSTTHSDDDVVRLEESRKI
jgi:mannose-6-phosphate isomerase-like protein (cupin superfamily)